MYALLTLFETYLLGNVCNTPIIFACVDNCCRKHEKQYQPSLLTHVDSMRQTATQMWCLIRFLPQLIGHKVTISLQAFQRMFSSRFFLFSCLKIHTSKCEYGYGLCATTHHWTYRRPSLINISKPALSSTCPINLILAWLCDQCCPQG